MVKHIVFLPMEDSMISISVRELKAHWSDIEKKLEHIEKKLDNLFKKKR